MFETLTCLIIEIIPRSKISHGLLFIVGLFWVSLLFYLFFWRCVWCLFCLFFFVWCVGFCGFFVVLVCFVCFVFNGGFLGGVVVVVLFV